MKRGKKIGGAVAVTLFCTLIIATMCYVGASSLEKEGNSNYATTVYCDLIPPDETNISMDNTNESWAPLSVFYPDDREEVMDTTSFPWSTICKVYTYHPSGETAVGTAFIVDGNHALTAGHLLYLHDEDGWAYDSWAESVKIVPAMSNGMEPFGHAWGTYMRSESGWTDYQDSDYDWGLVTLDRNMGEYTGWMGVETAPSYSSKYTGTLNTAGYPSELESGTSMYYCTGNGYDADQYLHYHYLDSTGGQSGSPVWRYDGEHRYVLSINIAEGSSYNIATRIDQHKFDTLQDWLATDSSDQQYTLTTSVSPSDGGYITLNPSGGTYDGGTEVIITAHANNSYQFDGWSGDATGSTSTLEITMNENKTVTAHFTTASQGTIELTPTDDAYIDTDETYTNHGSETSLDVFYFDYIYSDDNFGVTYLKFDTSGIPQNTTIDRADLELYCYYNGLYDTPLVGVWGGTWTAWSEDTITPANNEVLDNLISGHYIYTEDTWYDWDVTDFIQNHSGESVTFMMLTSTDTGWASFWSKEYSYELKRPSLVIDYSQPNQPPSCSLTANPSTGNPPFTATFYLSGSDSDGSISSWSLDVKNDGSTVYSGTGSPPSTSQHTYQDVGTYTANLTVTDDDGAQAYDTVIIGVANVPPNADFSYTPSDPDIGETINFTDESIDSDGNIQSYSWEFGDGNTSSQQNPQHHYPQVGTYQINLTITDDDGANDTISKNITVTLFDPPLTNFSWSPAMPHTNEDIQFTDMSIGGDGSIQSWHWQLGDGNTSTAQNFTYQYADNGVYMVNLSVTDSNGLSDSVEKQITVANIPPSAHFVYTVNDDYMLLEVNASNSSDQDGSIINYSWDWTNDGTYDDYGITTNHTYSTVGAYAIKLRIRDDDEAIDTITQQIYIGNLLPTASFTVEPETLYTTDILYFNSTSNDPDGSITTWTWDFDDGITDSGEQVTHQYTNEGTYQVNLTITDNDGETNHTTKIITVLPTPNQPPNADFTWSPSTPQTDSTITFDGTTATDTDGTITQYAWDWDNDGTYDAKGSNTVVTHSWNDDGNYQVTLQVTDDNGANDTKTQTITIANRAPTAGFTFSPSNPTPGETITFTSSCFDSDGSIISYSWDLATTSSSTTNPAHIYPDSGTYTISLTIQDDDGATATTSETINVNEPPTADFSYTPSNPTDMQTIQFTDQSTDTDGTIISYSWDFGDGNTSTSQNPSHNYTDDGTYTLTLLIEDDDGTTNTTIQDITVKNVKPTANFTYTPPSPAKVDTTFNFTDNSTDSDGTIDNRSWNFGDGTTGCGQTTNHTYTAPGTYDVTLIVTDNDGDTDTYVSAITVEEEKEGGTPGFGLALLVMSIAAIVLVKRRKG